MSGVDKYEDKMTDSSDQEEHIFFKLNDKDGNEMLFKMKRSTMLKKLMYAYCDRMSFKVDDTRFLFRGCRLLWHQTPDQLEMEEGECIDPVPGIGYPRFNELDREAYNPMCVCTYTYTD